MISKFLSNIRLGILYIYERKKIWFVILYIRLLSLISLIALSFAVVSFASVFDFTYRVISQLQTVSTSNKLLIGILLIVISHIILHIIDNTILSTKNMLINELKKIGYTDEDINDIINDK